MAKHSVVILFVLAVITAIFFSGCSIPYSGNSYSGNSGSANSSNTGITTGIVSSDSRNRGKADTGSAPDPSKTFDDKEMFPYVAGIKVGYDSSPEYASLALALSTASYSEQLFADLIDALSAGYDDFDADDFLSFHSNMGLDSTKVYRLIWIYNLIEQYDLLSKLLISDIVGNYGFGYPQSTELNSLIYPIVDLGASITPTSDKLGNIDLTATLNLQSLVLDNPNYIAPTDPDYSTSTYAYKDYESFTLDLENSKLVIDTNEYNVVVPTSVISEFKNWAINYFDSSKAYLEYVNSFSFENPIYDSNNLDSTDIASHQVLYINATISNSTLSYQLSLQAPAEVAMNSGNYLDTYINENSLYLAYKIFEAVCDVPVADRFTGTPDQIGIFNFLPLIPTYLSMNGRIGLVEKDFVVSVGDLTFVEKILDILESHFVGFDDAVLSTALQGFITARINQYVVDSQNCVECATSLSTDAKKLFVDSYNIEYVDISLDALYEAEDNPVTAYGNIVSVVFMTDPVLSDTMYFEALCLVFSAKDYDVNLSTYFRFVQDGVEKIFANFDYATARELEEDFASDFDGNIPKLEGEADMEYAESTTLNISKESSPNSNVYYNHEMLMNGFTNNNPSNYLRAVNVRNGSVYSYDSSKNCYYYNEVSNSCDYIELALKATNLENKILYSFAYMFYAMEEKTP